MTKESLSNEIEENDREFMEEYDLDDDEKFWVYTKHVKQFIKEILDEIERSLKDGIKRNNILPLDWAMDRIKDIIKQKAGDLK